MAAFRAITADDHQVPRPWAEHQVETTVDFAQGNRLLAWYLGGLNFQIEHHLFPRDLPRPLPGAGADRAAGLSRRTASATSRYPTFGAAIRSHLRQLHEMGKRPVCRPREETATAARE